MKPFFKYLNIVFFAFLNLAQAQQSNLAKFYSYKFDADSLKGFDELAATKASIDEGFQGEELEVKLYRLKRAFINNLYQLEQKNTGSFSQFNYLTELGKFSSSSGNEDFEASPAGAVTSSNQIAGWEIVSGSHTLNPMANSCNLLGCCPLNPSEAEIISAPTNGYIDPIIGIQYPIHSVFGSNTNSTGLYKGNKFLRINSLVNNYSVEMA